MRPTVKTESPTASYQYHTAITYNHSELVADRLVSKRPVKAIRTSRDTGCPTDYTPSPTKKPTVYGEGATPFTLCIPNFLICLCTAPVRYCVLKFTCRCSSWILPYNVMKRGGFIYVDGIDIEPARGISDTTKLVLVMMAVLILLLLVYSETWGLNSSTECDRSKCLGLIGAIWG